MLETEIVIAIIAFVGGVSVPIVAWVINRSRVAVDIAAVHAATARTTTETALELVTALKDDNARLRARNILLRALLVEHHVEVPDDMGGAGTCQSYGVVREDGERRAAERTAGEKYDDAR